MIIPSDSDRRGYAPPIMRRDAATLNVAPRRLHRTKTRNRSTPPGAVYVGRPTIWGNPFAGRQRINHKRSVIFYRAWLNGDLSPHVLARAGFGLHEIDSLARLRSRVLAQLPMLAGRDLQCWCPLTSNWCHAEVLLELAARSQSFSDELPGIRQ